MTVTLPPWEAWPLAALALLGASVIAGLTMAGAITVLKRRAGGLPAPGDGHAPVPGTTVPPEAARPPSRPSPAPGSCALCGWYHAWRPDLRLWVERYEHCPAHAGKERQPNG